MQEAYSSGSGVTANREVAAEGQGRALWLRWVGTHALLGLVAWSVATLGAVLTYGYGGILALPLVILALIASQWLPIRNQLGGADSNGIRWAFATLAGMIIGPVVAAIVLTIFFFTFRLGTGDSSVWLLLIGVFAGAALMGLAQWLVLRHHARHAFWWVPTNVLAVLAALFAHDSVYKLLAAPCPLTGEIAFSVSFCSYFQFVASAVIGTIVFGLITGTVLVLLLRKPA